MLPVRFWLLLCLACCYLAQTFAQDPGQFTGTWKLLSYERRSASGEVSYPYGEKPIGQLIYDGKGHMAAQIMPPGRAQFHADRPAAGSGAEKVNAFDTYIAYSGTYKIDAPKHLVYHHVEMSMFPNWVGSEQKREYEFSGGHLILTVRNGAGNGSGPAGSISRLVWAPASH